MGIRKYRPTSPALRQMTVSTFEEITSTEPEKSLLAPLKSKAGRNVHGRITVRHKGGGEKRKYRIIDFKRNKDGIAATVKTIAVLDRTIEQGGREPLYLDVREALKNHKDIRIIGGRYGLSSRDTAPNQIKAVYDEMLKDAPKDPFTIGVYDDVNFLSLDVDPKFHIPTDYTSCLFFGLGSDGTVSANKS